MSIRSARLTRDILRQPPWSYALAAIVPTTVLLIIQAAGVFVDRLPGAPLLAAVLAVAWYCGRLPALLSTAISIGFHAYMLIPSPGRRFDVADAVALILFAGVALFVSYATPRLGQTLRELELERKREQIARTEAERHSQEAHELRRLSRALTHTDSATAAAQRVADAVKRLFDPSSAVVRLLEPDGAMVTVAIAGENPVVTPGHRMPAGSGVVGQAVTQRRLVMTDSVLTDPRIDLPSAVRDQHERLGHQLVIAAPLIVDDVVIGTLALNETRTRTFLEPQLALLEALANHAAVGIRNAQRFEQERTARQEAETSSRTKDEFLAMLGHELRNPLAAIGSAIAVLNRLSATDERSVHARVIITRQVAHLRELMDDLLDVGRVTTGKIILSPKTIDLSELARRSWAVLESTGAFAKHKTTLQTEPVWVHVDETRMAQVIDNLLSNAVKYTPAGGSVLMTVRCVGDDAIIQVIDTGIGLSPLLLPRIFDPFVQGESTRDRAKGGLGIGLTLVKRLVELHGGSVDACSDGPDQGSIFTVRLPRLAVPKDAVATTSTRAAARRSSPHPARRGQRRRTADASRLVRVGRPRGPRDRRRYLGACRGAPSSP